MKQWSSAMNIHLESDIDMDEFVEISYWNLIKLDKHENNQPSVFTYISVGDCLNQICLSHKK